MYYQGNALHKREPHFWLGFACVCIVLLACILEAWGHDTPQIRNASQTHTLTKVWSDGEGHWHEDADGRGAGAWDQCVADAYDPDTDSYDLMGGQCAEESTPLQPPPPPPLPQTEPPQTPEQPPEQPQEQDTRNSFESQPKVPETEPEPEPEHPKTNKPDAPEPEPEQQVEKEQAPTPTGFYEFDLELDAGWNLVHIPLELLAIDDQVIANETIGELFLALGVNIMFYYDDNCWIQADENTAVIRKSYQGFAIFANVPMSKTLLGLPLQGNLLLQEGMNIVGIPRHSSHLKRVSDFFDFYPNVHAVIVEDGGEIYAVGRAGDPGDIPISGGQAFGIISTQNYFTGFYGEPWGTEIYE